MENTKNPEATKSSISQTEAYFDSLLKEQSHSIDNKPPRKFKPFNFAILIIIISVSTYLALAFFYNATNVGTSSSTVTGAENKGAYFDPAYYSGRDRTVSGKINRTTNTIDEAMRFELLDNDGKNIAYIVSEEQDLNLSVGLAVEINGRLKSNTKDGKEIIEVKSIRLK